MKKIYAFDHFKGYDEIGPNDWCKTFVKEIHGNSLLEDVDAHLIPELIKLHNSDSWLPGVERIVLVPGDIVQTAPMFREMNMGVRFSIINIDVNLYDPVKAILDNIYDLLLPGGVVLFSGLSAAPCKGEALAFDEFMVNNPGIKIKKLPYSPYPRAYFVKE